MNKTPAVDVTSGKARAISINDLAEARHLRNSLLNDENLSGAERQFTAALANALYRKATR